MIYWDKKNTEIIHLVRNSFHSKTTDADVSSTAPDT